MDRKQAHSDEPYSVRSFVFEGSGMKPASELVAGEYIAVKTDELGHRAQFFEVAAVDVDGGRAWLTLKPVVEQPRIDVPEGFSVMTYVKRWRPYDD